MSYTRLLFFINLGDGNWRQAEAWIVLLAGAVEVNALVQGALRQFTQWLWIDHSTFQLTGGRFATDLLPPSMQQAATAPYRNELCLCSRIPQCACKPVRRVCSIPLFTSLTFAKRLFFLQSRSSSPRVKILNHRFVTTFTTAISATEDVSSAKAACTDVTLMLCLQICEKEQQASRLGETAGWFYILSAQHQERTKKVCIWLSVYRSSSTIYILRKTVLSTFVKCWKGQITNGRKRLTLNFQSFVFCSACNGTLLRWNLSIYSLFSLISEQRIQTSNIR